jgi:hypothetical protein
MIPPNGTESEWKPTQAAPSAPEAWQATRAQTSLATQFLTDEDEYLATEKSDIGRQTGSNERELFVSCAPAEALQQQFEHLHPEFITIHDIATTSSRKLLVGIAAASGRAMQKLTIRRQGYGNALATLAFVELPTADGSLLRVYSTEVDADTAARHGIARMLLGFSRLGVVMVGDLPAHAITSALKPLQEAMLTGPWPNRQMLLLPLASASALVSQGMALSRETGVSVRTTPQVARPADAWGFINGTWNRLREQPQPDGRAIPALVNSFTAPAAAASLKAPAAPAQQLVMRPMPPVPAPAPRAAVKTEQVLDRYVRQLIELGGMVSCCIFDVATGCEVTHAGASPGAADLAAHGTELLAAIGATSRKLGLGNSLPEAAITLSAHHLLIRAVPRHPGLALHAVLDKTQSNLTLARLQVLRLDSVFEDL